MFIVAFSAWDAYADPVNWWVAFQVRLAGAGIIIATGLFQKFPGNADWLPLMAKIRLVCAAMTVVLAATCSIAVMGSGSRGSWPS